MTADTASKKRNLIWLDLEMTGLNPDADKIMEMGIVITDCNLGTVAELGPIIIHQSQELLDSMDEWNTKTHSKSGLVQRCLESELNEEGAERMALDFVAQHCDKGSSPMCGNSICQDRRFLFRYMPKLEDFFHYRNLDVSTLKEIVRVWRLKEGKAFAKHGKHEALADVRESIEEFRYYLTEAFGVKFGEVDFNQGSK